MPCEQRETCGNCAHSQELTGLWVKLADEYVRCTVDKVEDCLHLTAKRNECHYQPSKWTLVFDKP